VAPCAIRIEQKQPPDADLLSSFLLSDLERVLHDIDSLPRAAAAYLGLHPPEQPWDALTDRQQVSALLQPGLFPLGRWPSPGLHPLTLLQQTAVNAIVRDLRGGFHNYLRLICLDQRSLAAAAHICAGRQGQPDWISDFCTSSPRSSMPVIGQQIAALVTRRPRRSAW
jgi:hypothetical protein